MWDIRYICQSDLIKQIIDNIETMENFIFQNPTKLIFGKGMIGQLAKEIPAGKRILCNLKTEDHRPRRGGRTSNPVGAASGPGQVRLL